MNIHSGYRKLNDYKGASCGQHSALSTQHSALNSYIYKVVLFCTYLFFGYFPNSYAGLKALPEPPQFYLLYNSSRVSSVEAGCKLSETELKASIQTWGPRYDYRLVSISGGPLRGDPWRPYNYAGNVSLGSARFVVDASWYCVMTNLIVDGIDSGNTHYRGVIERVNFCPSGSLIGTPPYELLQIYDEFTVKCWVQDDGQASTINLTLTPAPNQKDPRPLKAEGKDGKSTYELIAKVMEGSTPKAGVAVTFGVEPIANSGGHDHHDASRPKGLVNGALTASGKTEANGEIKVTFQASEFAGTHVVAAACSTCTNISATKNVDVKVPELIELQGDYSRGAKYELIGSTPKHQGNHFFSLEAMNALFDLLPIFAQFDWGVVGVNDSSLKWGGRFDIAGHWNGSHHEHRDGKEVDISFYKPFGTISEEARRNVYDELRKSKGVSMPNVLWHLEDNPNTGSRAHFHVYLLGQSSTRTTKY